MLNLGNTVVTDKALKNLSKLTRLRKLGLANTRLTDVGLKTIDVPNITGT